jgi:hypothetical protein
VLDTFPDLVMAVRAELAAALEQRLKLGRRRIGEQRSHRPTLIVSARATPAWEDSEISRLDR